MRAGLRVGLVALVVAACANGPILANPPAPRPLIAPPTARPTRAPDPLPIVLPRDDGPHDRLTEWWYYTGHLQAHQSDIRQRAGTYSLGRRYGFEFVIFRAERGGFPTTWASHLAVTDETGGTFHYAQRTQVGDAVDRSPRDDDDAPTGFDLALTGADPTLSPTLEHPPWEMSGGDGTDKLWAMLGPDEAASASVPSMVLSLGLESRKPPALHDRDGWIDFGPGGGSYYYSRTDMEAKGHLTIGDETFQVGGTAWFDHQWGDFISVGGGGWDWFAMNLDDGTDLTLSLVRDADGTYPLIYGTLVRPDGTTEHLGADAFTVRTTRHWTSPATGAEYPAGWSIDIPGERLSIDLTPTVAAQELDTRATTGVVYWEGSQDVTVRRGPDRKVTGGQAYVELTGYAPAGVAPAPSIAP
jgi:predicted secreted hydrolase